MRLLVGGAHTGVVDLVAGLRRDEDRDECGTEYGQSRQRFEPIADADQRVVTKRACVPEEPPSKRCDGRYYGRSGGSIISRNTSYMLTAVAEGRQLGDVRAMEITAITAGRSAPSLTDSRASVSRSRPAEVPTNSRQP